MAEPLIERVTQRVKVATVSPNHPDARHLFDMLQSEYMGMYGEPDPNPEGDFGQGKDCLIVVLYQDVRPVAIGGWTDEGDGVVCLRRMYVRYDHRKQGLARKLLETLEMSARTLRKRRVVLETGEAMQAAIRLYRSMGYEECEPFGYYGIEPYVDSVFLGKDL